MKSTLDTLGGLSRKLNIEVSAEKVSDTFHKMYQGIQKSATIKGFRKGKAPLSTIKSLYSDRVKQDVLQQLVSDTYHLALKEHSLDPVTQPEIEVVTYDESGSFQYTAELEVRPEIELKKVEGLTVEKEILELKDTFVEETLKNIQSNFKEYVPVFEDRPAQNGDFLKIDFDGYINGTPLDGGKADGHVLELGSNSFIPGFEEGLVGTKPGQEISLDLTFPIDYHVEDLKGQKVLFKIKVHEINKQSLPEINDELAQKVNPQFKSIDDLKKAIRDDFEKSETRRIQEDLKNRVLKELAKENPVDVPKTLLNDQKHRLELDVEQRLQRQGLDPEGIKQYKEKWKEDLDKTASFMVQTSFLIDKIAQTESLRPTAEDLDKKMNEMSIEMNFALDQIKQYYQDQDKHSALYYQVMEEKVISFLLDKAKIKEVQIDQLKEEA